MSASGQKRTCAVHKAMSALPPKADMCGALGPCPLCANSGHWSAIDDLVGAADHLFGVGASALAVLRLIVARLGYLLDRQVAGFSPLRTRPV